MRERWRHGGFHQIPKEGLGGQTMWGRIGVSIGSFCEGEAKDRLVTR